MLMVKGHAHGVCVYMYVGITAGFLSINMSSVFTYVNYASPFKWGAWIEMNTVMSGEEFTCSSSEQLSDGSCPISSGDQVISLYKMSPGGADGGMNQHVWILALECGVLFLMSYVILNRRANTLKNLHS